LPQTIAVVVVEWCYVNQSELGEAQESDSSSGGGDNPPIACKWLNTSGKYKPQYKPDIDNLPKII
jgi:hypothetical protein